MSSIRDHFAPPHVFQGDDQDDVLEISMEEIDLEALARAICDLLRRELKLERERQGWRPGW